MVENFDITSANAEVVLACEELYPSGVRLKQFSVDAGLSADSVDQTEARESLDGFLSAGVIKNPYPTTITLEASSPSVEVMETIRDAMQANNKPYQCTLTVYLPALEKTITFVRGVMTNAPSMPAIARTLQPVAVAFTFERIRVS